jgi:hypothetical protein
VRFMSQADESKKITYLEKRLKQLEDAKEKLVDVMDSINSTHEIQYIRTELERLKKQPTLKQPESKPSQEKSVTITNNDEKTTVEEPVAKKKTTAPKKKSTASS